MHYMCYWNASLLQNPDFSNTWGADMLQTPAKESEEEKLEKKFEELKEFLHEEGFVTIGRLCRVMGFECDNPYEFYCGDKDKWQKAVIDTLHEHRDDPEVTKQLIEVLHESYKDGEEE